MKICPKKKQTKVSVAVKSKLDFNMQQQRLFELEKATTELECVLSWSKIEKQRIHKFPEFSNSKIHTFYFEVTATWC